MLYYYSQLIIENGMNSNKNKYINKKEKPEKTKIVYNYYKPYKKYT